MTKETNSAEEAAENQRDEAAETDADTESELTKEKLAQLEETVTAKNSELTTLKEGHIALCPRYSYELRTMLLYGIYRLGLPRGCLQTCLRFLPKPKLHMR
jgi:hypothetical protein